MTFALLAVVCAALPLASLVIEWVVSTQLSERHHRLHDTYAISSALTSALTLAMMFMGLLGLVLSWLCMVGVFSADRTIMIAFFASFVAVMFVMWAALKRYRVAMYEDHLEVTPFFGPRRSVRYADIEQLRWASSLSTSHNRSVLVIVGGKVAATIVGTFDLDQILMRIDRNDVLENGTG